MLLTTLLVPKHVYDDSSLFVVLRNMSVESTEEGETTVVEMTMAPVTFDNTRPSEFLIQVMFGIGTPDAVQAKLAACV